MRGPASCAYGSAYGSASCRQPSPKVRKSPKEVRVAPATQTPLERATVALGSVAAYNQATISVKVPGRLRSIAIDFGSVVQQGQLIAQIDPQDYQLRVQQAEAALAQTRMPTVEAEVSNDGSLRPDLFARAEIVIDENSMAVTIPTKSIVTFAGIEKVIAVQNGRALEKPITTRRRSGDWTEVVAGVKVGEMVVVEPGNLQSGQPVTIVE
jgi:multidrug efflux pump subunit AcrA (membrane-fusion protein)